MAAPWVLVKWGTRFRDELNALAPKRDRASDGSVGNLAHQGSPSGHNPDESGNAERRDSDNINEVRAIDVDKDLRVPSMTAAMIVAYLVGRCRAGLERRLIYIIWDRTIWSASSGWVARRYTGSSPHTEHFHLSGHPEGDNDGRPFGLATLMEDDMTPAEMLAAKIRNPITGKDATVATFLVSMNSEAYRGRLLDEAILAAVKGVDTKAVLARINEVAAAESTRDAELADLLRKQQSGELTAEQVLAKLRDLLPAGTTPQS